MNTLTMRKLPCTLAFGLTVGVLGGASPALAAAPDIIVGNSDAVELNQFIYTPSGVTPVLTADTSGYLFCANVPQWDVQDGVGKLAPRHSGPANYGNWKFPVVSDIQTLNYGQTSLGINRQAVSSLVCDAQGAEGERASPIAAGIFLAGFETISVERYLSLVNREDAPSGNWHQWDAASVPQDPCADGALNLIPGQSNDLALSEPALCVSATGVQPSGAGLARSPIMRSTPLDTGSSGLKYLYAFRVDACLRDSCDAPPNGPQDATNPRDDGSVIYRVMDAYTSSSAPPIGKPSGYLSDLVNYCILTDPPTTLTMSTCGDAGAPQIVANGPIDLQLSLDSFNPHTTFYVVARRLVGSLPNSVAVPLVMASVFVEPAMSASANPLECPNTQSSDPSCGNLFVGDDVVFGFYNSASATAGFSWMNQ